MTLGKASARHWTLVVIRHRKIIVGDSALVVKLSFVESVLVKPGAVHRTDCFVWLTRAKPSPYPCSVL